MPSGINQPIRVKHPIHACIVPRHAMCAFSTSENWTLGVFNESVLIKAIKKQNKQEKISKKRGQR
jgi:hypothetical protein